MDINWKGFHLSLDEKEVKQHVPTQPGVYVLWGKLPTGKWHTLFVGEAENLRDRLLRHLSESERSADLKKHISMRQCGFEFALVDHPRFRKGIEKYLYDLYDRPECNDGDPGGEPIRVDLP